MLIVVVPMAAAQTSGLGVGVFDRADLGPDGLLVSGWVIDPDATTPSAEPAENAPQPANQGAEGAAE